MTPQELMEERTAFEKAFAHADTIEEKQALIDEYNSAQTHRKEQAKLQRRGGRRQSTSQRHADIAEYKAALYAEAQSRVLQVWQAAEAETRAARLRAQAEVARIWRDYKTAAVEVEVGRAQISDDDKPWVAPLTPAEIAKHARGLDKTTKKSTAKKAARK